jgi:hypothetical protein
MEPDKSTNSGAHCPPAAKADVGVHRGPAGPLPSGAQVRSDGRSLPEALVEQVP